MSDKKRPPRYDFVRAARLANMAEMASNKSTFWNKYMAKCEQLDNGQKELDPNDSAGQLRWWADAYRHNERNSMLIERNVQAAIFWKLNLLLQAESYIGPESELAKLMTDYGAQRNAIFEKHGWPEWDGDDVWQPEDHLEEDSIPEDWLALHEKYPEEFFETVHVQAFRNVCTKAGVPEIAREREDDPEAFGKKIDDAWKLISEATEIDD